MQNDDRGFGLVELAVYIVVLGLISTVIASVIVSLFSGQQTVSGVSNAASQSQIATTVLTGDVRNAREMRLVAENDLLLSVATGATAWECVRWRVNGESLERSTWADAGADARPETATLIDEVTRNGGEKFFSLLPGTGTSERVGTLNYTLLVPTTGDGAVDMTGSISNRMPDRGSVCFA